MSCCLMNFALGRKNIKRRIPLDSRFWIWDGWVLTKEMRLAEIEWIEESDDNDFTEPSFYVTDANGIVAGPFDDEGEAL